MSATRRRVIEDEPRITVLPSRADAGGVRVRLIRRGMHEDVVREVSWPPYWRIPEQGDSVSFEDIGGFVQWVEFRADDNVVLINLR